MSFAIEVVIATYNTAAYLDETLESVLSQHEELGIWVVDDGSTDGTAELVSRYLATGRVFYLSQKNSGRPAIPRNRGLGHVTAPYVVFFDGDDVMCAGHLRTQMALLKTNPQWSAVTCDYRNFCADGPNPQTQFAQCPKLQRAFSAQGKPLADTRQVIELREREAKLILAEENFFINGSAVYRTEAVRATGGFDTRLHASEDFDLFWRVTQQGHIGVSSFVSFLRRLHTTNISNDYARVLEAKRASRERLSQLEPDRAIRRILSRTVALTLGDLATLEMPVGIHHGARLLWLAWRRGIEVGVFPVEASKALAKALINRATTRSYNQDLQ